MTTGAATTDGDTVWRATATPAELCPELTAELVDAVDAYSAIVLPPLRRSGPDDGRARLRVRQAHASNFDALAEVSRLAGAPSEGPVRDAITTDVSGDDAYRHAMGTRSTISSGRR